jgi:hypothetical protein
MRLFLTVAACAAGLAACDSPTDRNGPLQAFDQTTFRGHALPIELGAVDGFPNCVDSLMAGAVEFTNATDAVWISNRVRNCSGVRSTQNVQRTGTYTVAGNDVDFVWEVNSGGIGTLLEEAVLSADRLEFVERAYTEGDPTVGGLQIWAVYQRR